MEYSLRLPFQLYRKHFLDLQNFWCGSFQTQQECAQYAHDIGMPEDEVLVLPSTTLPAMTDDEHHSHLLQIESDIKRARRHLLAPANLATKISCKSAIKALEKKRHEMRFNIFQFVREK